MQTGDWNCCCCWLCAMFTLHQRCVFMSGDADSCSKLPHLLRDPHCLSQQMNDIRLLASLHREKPLLWTLNIQTGTLPGYSVCLRESHTRSRHPPTVAYPKCPSWEKRSDIAGRSSRCGPSNCLPHLNRCHWFPQGRSAAVCLWVGGWIWLPTVGALQLRLRMHLLGNIAFFFCLGFNKELTLSQNTDIAVLQ